jgi:hypothetical protein
MLAHHVRALGLATAAVATLAIAAPNVASATTPITSASTTSMPTTSSLRGSLQAVAGSAPTNAWAVGSRWTGSQTVTLIQHWDGVRWRTVPSPSPGGANGSYLEGVSVVSAADVWAVGNYYANAALTDVNTLVEHWDGTSWTTVASPSPKGYVDLAAVSAVSASDAWAVGVQRTPRETTTLVEHWDGSQWSRVANPIPAGPEQLFGVSAISATNAWAVGHYTDGSQDYQALVEHWDGTSWSVVDSPSPGPGVVELRGVTAVTAHDAWAVGSYTGHTLSKTKTFVEHWDGTGWNKLPSPSPSADSSLWGVSAESAKDAWAVGSFAYGSEGFTKTLVLHWDGTAWTKTSSPTPGGDGRLLGVSAVSTSDAWGVGDTYDLSVRRTLTQRWDGTSWENS